MKSRFLLPSNLPETHHAPDARPKASLARRFELRYNVSPRFARRRQQRRQGQALLLAVLIMLLAALLSAGFLAVVSGNLNQTARIADKTKAIEASRAGIVFANEQLSGSAQGDLWRPIDVSPAPNTTDASYDFYYSQLDKAQGWAAKRQPLPGDGFPNTDYNVPTYGEAAAIYHSDTYAKFPAPDQPSSDAPKFLVRVQEIPILLPNDPNYNAEEAKHAGELKITSIGLSDDDPNVFHTSIAYKNGRRKSPWASALRSISNWNFGANNTAVGVPYATVLEPVTVNMPTNNVAVQVNTTNTPLFSKDDLPTNVVLVNKAASPPTVRGAVITDIGPPATTPPTGSTAATFKFAQLDAPIDKNEVVQKAAAIGTGLNIDLLNTGTPTAVAANFPNYDQPNGILANGSLWLQNQVQLSNLSKFGTKLFVSGSLAIDDSASTVNKVVLPGGDVGTSPGGNTIVPSNVNYPGNNIVLTAAATSDGVKTTDFVNDGWNKIGAQTLGLDYSTTRDVEPFTPAKIDSATNLERYRSLTRNPSDGVYIDNRDDIEKVSDNASAMPPTFKAMTQAQLVEMLTSPPPIPPATVPTDYTRTGTATTMAGASLEQRHLRGWVGPDEFMARGALVELIQAPNANPYLRLTYDSRSDASFNGSDATKTFRDASGNLLPGVYTENLPWPKNGILFAEGNLRIRGQVNLSNLTMGTDPNEFPSLTVVSLGNIYIEGPLSVDRTDTMGNVIPVANRKKLMLLAKKNVIVNPTRAIMSRLDTQTLTSGTATVTPGTLPALNTIQIPVNNVTGFEQGDYIVAAGTPNQIRGVVTAVTPITNSPAGTIDVQTQDTGAIGVNALVLSPLETRASVGTAPNSTFFSQVTAVNAVNRRIPLAPAASPKYRLAMDHSGQRVTALQVKIKDLPSDADTFNIFLSNKRNLDTNGLFQANLATIDTANKKVRVDYDGPSPAGVDEFPQTYPTTQSAADGFNIAALEAEMNAKTHPGTPPPPSPPGWQYDVTPPSATNGTLPFYYLAGVGLSNASGVAYTNTNDWRKKLTTTATFDIPLANSFEFDLNGLEQGHFGFNPDFLAPTDLLTVDESFYQADTDVSKNSTLDSRALTGTLPLQNVVLRQSPQLFLNTLPAPQPTLPDERMRAMKLENIDLTGATPVIRPFTDAMNIDAFVYAQEGSWLVIPGDYFRSTSPVRSEVDASGAAIGTYIDFTPNNQPDAGEFILDTSVTPNVKVADLNRNGIVDPGEKEAALRFVRYNDFQIQFTGAIVENQTPVVADIKLASAPPNTPPLVTGAVQDWMDKWVAYDSTSAGTAADPKWKFINYVYDPSIANNSLGANQLRVPITDDLIYQQ